MASQSTGFRCQNPMCDLTFATYGNMRSHLTQAVSCKWWPAHAKDAAVKLSAPPAPNIVAGSIFNMSNSFWQDEDDEPMTETEEVTDEEDMDGVDGDYELNDIPEIAGPSSELLRELMEMNDPEDFYDVVHPNIAIGEEGPGPSTLRARLNRMLGAKRRYLDDDEGDVEDDGRVFDEHPTGGASIKIARNLHERWAALFGTSCLPTNIDANMDGTDHADLGGHNIYHPFASKLDWEIARWMVEDGIGHSSFNRLLAIDGVKERLGLSYSNTRGVHERVGNIPRRAGTWHTKHITFPDRPDDPFTLRHRDLLEVIQSLWGDPKLAKHLVYKPRKLFTNKDRETRIINEMWTAEWWWKIQDMLPETHTLGALIVSTDKTQLTQFSGSKQVYPIYLTRGLNELPSS